MAKPPTKTNRNKGRFVKSVSGNPSGRPKGATSHATKLKRLEDDGLDLATNPADVIAETARSALTEIELSMLIPLFDAICDSAKVAIRGGEIGLSSLALLRGGYDDHREGGQDGAFFLHAGLPEDCDWKTFEKHYTTRKRIDHDRHVEDLRRFPPIVQRIKELMEQRPVEPC